MCAMCVVLDYTGRNESKRACNAAIWAAGSEHHRMAGLACSLALTWQQIPSLSLKRPSPPQTPQASTTPASQQFPSASMVGRTSNASPQQQTPERSTTPVGQHSQSASDQLGGHAGSEQSLPTNRELHSHCHVIGSSQPLQLHSAECALSQSPHGGQPDIASGSHPNSEHCCGCAGESVQSSLRSNKGATREMPRQRRLSERQNAPALHRYAFVCSSCEWTRVPLPRIPPVPVRRTCAQPDVRDGNTATQA
jgi:hypothetical protein